MEFQGRIYPVNPGEIKDKIDIAIFAVPASIVLEILSGPVENIKGAIIVSSGFRETGPEGREMEVSLKENLEKKSIRTIGPNCLGIYDTASKVDTFL